MAMRPVIPSRSKRRISAVEIPAAPSVPVPSVGNLFMRFNEPEKLDANTLPDSAEYEKQFGAAEKPS